MSCAYNTLTFRSPLNSLRMHTVINTKFVPQDMQLLTYNVMYIKQLQSDINRVPTSCSADTNDYYQFHIVLLLQCMM